MSKQWEFWVDRGGTFTDVVAKTPKGEIEARKYLSENPEAYDDAVVYGVRDFLKLDANEKVPADAIKAIKMGTTVATNTLLERKGQPTVLVISEGLGDVLEIGYQARPDIFALKIEKPSPIYARVIEIEERVSAGGCVEKSLNQLKAIAKLKTAFDEGYRSIAIVLMHGHLYPDHEKKLAELAIQIGFTQISISHDVSPLPKIVARGDTTVLDAYLTPVLQNYIERLAKPFSKLIDNNALKFMQSAGGLIGAKQFRGRDAILSGPAGGVIGAVETASTAGFKKIIGFDMGGTSTDVFHYAGQFEKTYEAEVAGARLRVPMLYVHTVAAGGGSLLRWDGQRMLVGPQSAGANPGPVCYRRGGQLAVTDINVCLGKLLPEYFPAVFGENQKQTLDVEAAKFAFKALATEINPSLASEELAQGFLDIAVEHMAQAIKKISVSRGYNVKDYVLACYGGAGGQHVCLVAERLGIEKIFIHPLAGVLSAYGMGLALTSIESQQVVAEILNADTLLKVDKKKSTLIKKNQQQLQTQGLKKEELNHEIKLSCRYQGSDTEMQVLLGNVSEIKERFEALHRQQFGFITEDRPIIIESILVSSFNQPRTLSEIKLANKSNTIPEPQCIKPMHAKNTWHDTPVYNIEALEYGHQLVGPAIVIEKNGTLIVEPGWRLTVTNCNHVVLSRENIEIEKAEHILSRDPVTLEIFNHLFMSIAEQMGIVLRNTSRSVNIKERLDFSCAIFDQQGSLVANAPHVPVHLGSMGFTIKSLLDSDEKIEPGDVFVQNNPYLGGSHLPDITVITPVFNKYNTEILFYVASRAHHEDVGGILPGSMPSSSVNIMEEGVVINNFKLVKRGVFQEQGISEILLAKPYPARNVDQNIADLKAQVAANNCGLVELKKLVEEYGLETVQNYMGFIQDSAEEAIRAAIKKLKSGRSCLKMDCGAEIKVDISIDQKNKKAVIDFSGTSDQVASNFNAPIAITYAATLYVFRCLIEEEIPLNAGCLKPIKIIIPEGCLLNPVYPAALVAGNVETSQVITDALFQALGILGTSQGSMNNLTFGNERVQYYETLCSGSAAGPGFDGTAGVHTHMTNTRLTDPEILEQRYPVTLEKFSIRRGSGGRGKWNAGDGTYREIRFNESMVCSILSNNREVAPIGSDGGENGEAGRNWITRKNGVIEKLKGCGHSLVESGDRIHIQTPTGGGFGILKK